jgi:hypothetical protein
MLGRNLVWEFIILDNSINYWSEDQVICMRNLIKKLYESPEEEKN